jgi:RHS repeat-associated protein
MSKQTVSCEALKYDERNQLVGFEARRGATLLRIARYRYDCFNRRVALFADLDGDEDDDIVTYSVYGGQAAWRLLEEYPTAEPTPDLDGFDGSALRSYVYGNYIDEVLSMRDHGSGEDFFYLQDDLFSVYALTDGDGAVVERYDYGDYGQVSIMEANGTPRAASAYDNRHAFTGRLLMPELTLDDGSQILEYRHRYLHTASGRFVQRDPLGYVDGMNLYQYGLSRPMVSVDPFGEHAQSSQSFDHDGDGIPDHLDPDHPSNDKSKGCGITEEWNFGWPPHPWIMIPDPGVAPSPSDPIGRPPGPDPWEDAPGIPWSPRPSKRPGQLSIPLRTLPDQGPGILIAPPSPGGIPIGNWPESNPPLRTLCAGSGAGKLLSAATCEEIRDCIRNCNTGLAVCYTGLASCKSCCGLSR